MADSEVRVLRAATLEETHAFARRLALALREHLASEGDASSAFIGLDGDLGAGKTALTQGFVSALDPESGEEVTSPTFAIVQEYPTEPRVTHLDLYRLGSFEDLEAIGYRELYFRPGVVLVEWSERVPEALPSERIEIALAVLPTDVREIRIRPHGPRFVNLVEQVLG